jgi:HlyD family secretion protein
MRSDFTWFLVWLIAGLVAAGLTGCKSKPEADSKLLSGIPQVQVVKPVPRTIVRKIGQPSFVEAYEQTAIYPKFTAYLEEWCVDIGDRVKKNDKLAVLFIPELRKEYEQKKAMVKECEALVQQAKKLVAVQEANLKAAKSQVNLARANVGQSQALVRRWDSEVNRLAVMVKDRVVDKQVLAESERQLESNQASFTAAEAAVETALANELASQAHLEKAQVDVNVASARLEVAVADQDRLKALVGYLTLRAPYDGIIVSRNANTGDFVLPAGGDPSAAPRSSDQSAAKATPIYVVARTDVVRIYVDVAEADAINIVCKIDKEAGDPRPLTTGAVQVYSLNDTEIPGDVKRCSWALNFKSRTLRTEIDLPNTGANLRPGMYAFGKLVVNRPDVKAVPLAAVQEIGNQFGCYLHVGGKAVWTQVQTGVNDGTWIELQKKLVNSVAVDFDGSEEVIVNNFSELSNGKQVKVSR